MGVTGFTGSAGTGSAITVVGNATTLTQNLSNITFTGTGVTAVATGNNITINIASGPGSGNETLVWTVSGDNRILTGYKENSITKTVRTAAFVSSKLQLTLATFTPILTAAPAPGTSLNWDVAATGFSVSVTNPTDVTDQYINSVTSITATAGSISAFSTFIAGTRSNIPAGGISWTQIFSSGGSTFIRPISTTITGGSVSAQVGFSYHDGSSTVSYPTPATWSINWSTPALTISLSNLTGSTFLQSYSSVAYTISVTGITNASNYAHSVTALGGTVSNATGSGTFTFTAPLHKDNAGSRTTSVQTTFTRPIAVTGASYPVQVSVTSLNPSATFTYLSLWVFTAGVSTIPTRSTYVIGTGFQAGVTQLANLASSLVGSITNSSGGPQALWFAVKATASQPTTFKTGASAGLLSDVAAVTGNTVDLQPDSPLSGYVAVTYNLYGITLQNGSTFVSIT